MIDLKMKKGRIMMNEILLKTRNFFLDLLMYDEYYDYRSKKSNKGIKSDSNKRNTSNRANQPTPSSGVSRNYEASEKPKNYFI